MSLVHQHQAPPAYADACLPANLPITNVGNLPTARDNSPAQTLITLTPGNEADPVTEDHKKCIYRHPLFPLMALLFEKCEQASQSLDAVSSSNYDEDIQAFLEHAQQQNKSFFTQNTELDNLMVKVIQVLRIHLLELEKVSDLCKDFCMRYIACLKGKLHSEHLLRIDDLDSPPDSPVQGTTNTISTMGATAVPMATLPLTPVMNSLTGGMMMQPGLSMATISQGQIISGNTVYQMLNTPQGIVAQPIQIQAPSIQQSVGSNPMVSCATTLPQVRMVTNPVTAQQQIAGLSGDEGGDDDDPSGKRKNGKRGVLPKHATQVMKSWLFQHLVHPYPTEDEKRQIAGQTNLTLLQVNNWFINARRRILQPMLDAGSGEANRIKKSKPTSRPQQRFWPEAIANITPQLPSHLVNPKSATTTSSPCSSSSDEESGSETTTQCVVSADGQLISLTSLSPATILTQTLDRSSLQAKSSSLTPLHIRNPMNADDLVLSFAKCD